MGFFLRKTWPWWLLAAFVAWLVTWLLCRWRNRRGDAAELTAARHEAAEARIAADQRQQRIDGLLNQRARDLDELTRLRAAAETAGAGAALGLVGVAAVAAEPAAAEPAPAPVPEAPPEPAEPQAAEAEPPAAAIEPVVAAPTVLSAEALAAGAALLGHKLVLDDLKVVEGIGPAIAELLQQAGVHTWRQLEATETSRIQAILEAAGPRFRVHDPATWPRQAGLLADGRWQEFKDLTDALDGGRQA